MNVTTLARIQRLSRCRVLPAALLSAALCLAASTAHAIVGYVNVPLTNGYTFVANPLDAPPNALTNLVSGPVGMKAYFWDVTNQVFLPPATRRVSGWDRNYDMPLGRGVVLFVPARYTNTFVGNVLQGALTNAVAGSNKFSLLGCMAPVGGSLSINTNGVGFPRIDGATVHFFRSPSQTFADGFTCFTNYGWFDPKGVESTNGPALTVGESFFVQNPGAATNWVRIVTNGEIFVYGPAKVAGAPASSPLYVRQMAIQDGDATLTIVNPANTRYDVQFSTDGVAWKTVSANQSGSKWKGLLPNPLRGQFQVVASSTKGGAK